MGAVLVVGDMAAERERVQELVDLVPAKHLEAAARMMRGLLEEPVLVAFAYATVDEEEWNRDFRVIDEIRAGFAGFPEEKLEQEVALARERARPTTTR